MNIGDKIYRHKLWIIVIHVFLVFNLTLAKKSKQKLLVDTLKCKIPMFDPFDKEILKCFKNRPGPLSCKDQPFFFNVVNGNTVTPNERALNKMKIKASNLVCTYREIVSDNNDFYKFKKAVKFNLGDRIDKDYVLIECRDSPTKKVIDELVALVPDKRSPKKSSNLNIIIIGLDSTSALGFHRHFPRSLHYLTGVLKAKEFNGYHKVGSNTFPNLVPLLTGHPSEDYWNDHNKSNVHFDNADLIWKHFKNEGYKTMYLEDRTPYNTFNWYKKRGFKHKPVDHYYRPMALALEHAQIAKKCEKNCYKSKMEIEIHWDYLKRFCLFSQKPFFAFTFVSKLLHEAPNNAGYLDVPLQRMLKDLSEAGVLNQSLLIVFSDHGYRVGNLRKTKIGFYEERLPIAFLRFPDWFYSKHKCAHQRLKENQNKLTTHFDIHATLLHILRMQTGKSKYCGKTKYGRSLMTKISPKRTCKNAGIIQHWCACSPLNKAKPSEPRVKSATELMMKALNTQLQGTKCSKLHSQKVIAAYTSTAPNGTYVVVKSQPGGAVLEASILQGEVLRPISRLDSYGEGGKCLAEGDASFPFCHCPKV